MSTESQAILVDLHKVLGHLQANPYPFLPTPQGCKKRASVAVIIRIRPAFEPLVQPSESVVSVEPNEENNPSLDDFFLRSWVQAGDPEILFIKRAGRAGDRWAGHIALPGGKRDPEDNDDIDAAIRETREEVGLDLTASNCIAAGNLPQRVIATTFGRSPLMTLSPYLFLLTSKEVSRIRPQPTEVASAHWVPIRALLSKNTRTREYVDTASRMAQQGGPIAQLLLRMTVGKMVFSAVRLAPSESIYASSIPGFLPEKEETHLEGMIEGILGIPSAEKRKGLTNQQPLVLWGLTLGVLADFLDMLPPYNAVQLWRYPTFTVPDLRLLVWLLTRGLRRDNAGELSAGTWPNHTAIDSQTEAVPMTSSEPTRLARELKNDVGISGLGLGSNPNHAVSRLLAGYYERINVAIVVFVAYRSVVTSAAVYWLYKLWLRRRGSQL